MLMYYFQKNTNTGFSIKELIMVMVVIGILCIAAIPQFYAMQNSRRQTQMEIIVRQVQSGIFKIKTADKELSVPIPEILDNEPINQTCQNCFSLILEEGIENNLWYKLSATEYLYSRNGNFESADDYKESGDFKISYDKETGTLLATQI